MSLLCEPDNLWHSFAAMEGNMIMKDTERIVVKIGTTTIMRESRTVNLRTLDNLARILSDIKGMGNEVILVSSGAIAVEQISWIH